MLVFLDENVPAELASEFRVAGHEVVHIEDLGMKGTTNGALLSFVSARFDVFVTADTSLEFQQRLDRFNVAIILLHPVRKTVDQLRDLIPAALAAMPAAPRHRVTRICPEGAPPARR